MIERISSQGLALRTARRSFAPLKSARLIIPLERYSTNPNTSSPIRTSRSFLDFDGMRGQRNGSGHRHQVAPADLSSIRFQFRGCSLGGFFAGREGVFAREAVEVVAA